MSNIKTAVSIDKEIFQKAEKAAQELKLSRSQLFARALESYLMQLEDKKILDKLKTVYAQPDMSEEKRVSDMKAYHKAIINKEEW